MNKPIYYVGGGKGGVGKSMVSMALLDYLAHEKGENTYLVETDTSNPDVYKTYAEEVPAMLLNLDKEEGWLDLINVADANREAAIVINSAARNADGVNTYGELLNETVAEMKRKLIVFWVINRNRDSVELLKEFMNTITNADIHVIKNLYFGRDDEFTLYNGSNTRAEIERRGGKSLSFKRLAECVSTQIYNERISIETAMNKMPYSSSLALKLWRRQVRDMFDAAIPPTAKARTA
jgi:MinD-like ATPase involved in chromosome partitioning or flagellar assembly